MSTESDPPNSPQWNAFLVSLREEYPTEFNKEPKTLKQFLKDADRNIAVEEDFLDNPDPVFQGIEEVPDEDE